MLVEHYILSRSPYFVEVCEWLKSRSVTVEPHLNRTRFSIDSASSLYTEFLLRYAKICPIVDPTADLAAEVYRLIFESNQPCRSADAATDS